MERVLVLAVVVLSVHFALIEAASPSPMPVNRMKRWADVYDDERLFSTLERIAVERVVGTAGHTEVLEWLGDYLSREGKWTVERDSFEAMTPNGMKRFSNIVATINPNAQRRLVVAAHVDSKYFPAPRKFVAATDSATGCAILLDLAKVMEQHISSDADATLQLIFFDGEEAFGEWTATDSLYGSRHLAEAWEKEGKLSGIDLFVLLDLIGGDNAAFYSLFEDTSPFFARLQAIEGQLLRSKSLSGSVLESNKQRRQQPKGSLLFKGNAHHIRGVEDDHVPFLRRGVPILHLISLPFPSVWHTDEDTVANVNRDMLSDFNKVIRVFVAEYFALKSPVVSP